MKKGIKHLILDHGYKKIAFIGGPETHYPTAQRYKAYLVAKGFTQREGIDYKETFFPVSSKDSFRIIMALIAHFDLELHQIDVRIAFLNGNIDETIYMV